MHNNRILLKQDKCLVLQPELVHVIGRSPALLLQQIHYWLSSRQKVGQFHEGRRWVYNSYDDWVHEIQTLSKSTINRAIAHLKKQGIILIKKLSRRRGDRTNWYTIDYDKVSELLGLQSKTASADAPLKTVGDCDSCHTVKMTSLSTQNESMNMEQKITTEKTKNPINQQSIKSQEEGGKQSPLAEQMLTIWCQNIDPNDQISLTPKRARHLIAALKYKFDSDLKRWQHYCQAIASSDFLMGKSKHSFKASLDWVLKFDIIQRIRERQFGVKSYPTILVEDRDPIIIDEGLPSWEQEIRKKLLRSFGDAIYRSWFQDCQVTIHNQKVTFSTDNPFRTSYIASYFYQNLQHLFQDYQVEILTVKSPSKGDHQQVD